jgi:hypothetical protein
MNGIGRRLLDVKQNNWVTLRLRRKYASEPGIVGASGAAAFSLEAGCAGVL